MTTPATHPKLPRRFGRRFALTNKGFIAGPGASRAAQVAVTDPQLGVTGKAEEREATHG